MSDVMGVIAAILLVVGALTTVVASVGLFRLGDVRSRMHAATKPATLGVLCCAAAAALRLGEVSSVTKVVVIAALQLITAPVGAHMLSRAVTVAENRRSRGDDAS